MKRILFIFILMGMFCLSACQDSGYDASLAEKYVPSNTVESTTPAEEKTEHITLLLNRYVEGFQQLKEDALVSISGPVTLDDPFYKFYVDTIPANGYGAKSGIRFYVYEDTIQKSFSVTLNEDFSLSAVRQFISLTVYATETGLSYADAEAEMKKMIAEYDGDAPSKVFEGSAYYVYITDAEIGEGYTIYAKHKSEINTPVDKLEFE